MTETAQSSTQSEPKSSDSSSAKRKSKRSSVSSGAKELVKALEEANAPAEVINGVKKVDVAWNVLQAKLKEERDLRMKTQMELESARVRINILEIERDAAQNAIGSEKYEGIEDAGGW